MKIYIDIHEPQEIINSLRYDRGLAVEVLSMKSGDYAFSNIGIERKTYKDYRNSLNKRRLWKQIFILKKAFDRPYLVIEGFPNDETWKSERERRATVSSISRISLLGVNIVLLSGTEESACSEEFLDFVEFLFLASDKKTPSWKPVPKKGERHSTMEVTEDMLCMIPGVSRRTAKEIMQRFSTLEKLCQASERDLKNIPLIGAKRAKQIYEILHIEKLYRKENKRMKRA